MAKRDYYEVLGVARDVSTKDLEVSFRRLAMKYHPDRNVGDEEAEAKVKEGGGAYAVLADGDKRAAYDRYGHEGLNGGGRRVRRVRDQHPGHLRPVLWRRGPAELRPAAGPGPPARV